METKLEGRDVLSADLILMNGNVLTVDKDFSRAEAVAVKDGRIVRVGKNREVKPLAGKGTMILDLQGKTVLPGFIDAHCHMWMFGIQLSQVDCRSPPTKSIVEIVEKIGERVKKTPPGRWMVGWGYDDTKLAERRHPNRWDLDRVSPNNPVAVRRTCGHTMVVNTKALEIIDYGKDTPQPEGGEIEKDPDSGEPTGILRETAMEPVNDIIRAFSVEEIEEAIKIACQHALKEGLTSYQEAGLTTDAIKAYQRLYAKGELPVRVYMMVRSDLLDVFIEAGITTGFGDDWLRVGPIKVMMDGGVGGKTAALYEPYEGTEDNVGIIYMSQEKLDNLVKKAHDGGFQVAIHAIGDRAIDVSLNALERAIKDSPREDHRHRVEHCGLSTPTIIRRLQKLSVLPAGQPPFLNKIGASFKTNLGSKRIRWTYPFKTWFEEGFKPSGSSDRPVVLGAPLVGIWAAVNRRTEAGAYLTPEEGVTPEQAIRMYTINAAYTSFEEEIKGSVEPGKLADMVVLSDDPTRVPPDKIRGIEVLSTIVAGKVVYVAP
ncbi:MAG: amidohydrolase [Candidatus Bathyarchaeia archaeon]